MSIGKSPMIHSTELCATVLETSISIIPKIFINRACTTNFSLAYMIQYPRELVGDSDNFIDSWLNG